jgi:ankyrin repeat protein
VKSQEGHFQKRKSSMNDTRYEDFRNNLYHSVASGNVAEVSQALTTMPPSVSVADDCLRDVDTNQNILHAALENDQTAMAKYIIENCDEKILTQSYSVGKDFKTPLHQITENHNIDLAKALLGKLHNKEAKIAAIKAETTIEVEGQRPRSLSSFHLAAFKGFTSLVKLYIETGIDINFRNSKRDTALLWASRWGHLETVSYLLNRKADCMLENDKSSTALHWAVRYEHADVVRMLLSKGKADPHKERLQGLVVPIMLASALGNVRIIEHLLNGGANPNHVIRSGETPLHAAAKEGNAPVLSVLLQHKADVNRQDDNGNTPLINAASNDHLKCIDLLMKYGADPKCKNHMGRDTWYFALLSENDHVLKIVSKYSMDCRTPHLTAAKLGGVNKIKALQKTGIDINQVDEDGNALIHYAACFDQYGVISEFHSKVDVNMKNKKGNTAFHIACIKGHVQSMRALIEVKAKADVKNKDGHIPLHLVATSPNATAEIAKLLVEYTIKSHAWESLNSFDNNGDNALHLAAEKANPDVLWEFRSVRFKDMDHKGNTPLHDSVRPCEEEVLETMLDIFESMQRDADINTPNQKSETVLHLAASAGFQQSVSRIIFLGGDLTSKDSNGNTVLHRLVVESTECNDSIESQYADMIDTILNSVVRWWCMRNNCQIPNVADDKYMRYKRQAVLYLINDTKNKKSMSVIGLGCSRAAYEVLSKLIQIPGVTAFRDEDGTLYDVTYFTPKTSFSLRKHVCGQRVEQFPSISEEESDGKDDASNTKSVACLQLLVMHQNKQRGAHVLDIPPLRKMEEMFKSVCMFTYLVLMILHIIYMSVFTYASVTLLAKLRNNTNVPDSEFVLVYFWVPLEPLVFMIYFAVSFGRMIRRGDGITSLSWRFILLFVGYTILVIAWLILISYRDPDNDYVLPVLLCGGWLLTIAFTSGIKGIHYFWRMLRTMITRDIIRFLVFYMIVWFAFSFAFHAVFQISQEIADVYPTAGDTLFMVFNLMIGMAELFDDTYENGMVSVGRSTSYSKVLYMFYIILSTIILLNLLIAMMNDSYSSILAHERVIWRIDAMDIGINIEKTLPWTTSPFKWLHKRLIKESDIDGIGERWFVRVSDVEMSEKKQKQDASLTEYIKGELDSQIKHIGNRVSGLEMNIKDTHKKLEETTDKLDKIIDYFAHKKSKKEKRKGLT